MSIAIGVDLGGTKVEILAMDEAGDELVRRRRPTPRGSYEATLDAIAGLVHEVEQALGASGTVGVCHPGALSPATGLLKNANLTWMNGRPFDRDLMDRLGRPVAFANDANCLALSEATDGAAAGAAVVFGAILGTGCGGGIAVHGRVLTGPNAIAGEWGHDPLPWPTDDERPGRRCYCGLDGCLETWISGTGLAADHAAVTGEALAAPVIVARALEGEPAAAASLTRYEDRLARALAALVNLLDPHAIVLGGGMSNVARLYERVPALWDRWIFSDTVATRLVPARFGDSSGVRGAAWLGRDAAR